MSDTIRAFIAIPLDPKIQHSIEYMQDRLKKSNNDIKWVKPENIHITLKFLGDVTTEQINSVKQTLLNCTHNTRPFKVKLSQLGAFPNIECPRTLWIGLKDSKQQLNRMAVSLEKALGKIGFQGDQRPFRSHITIGRIRSSKNIDALSKSMSNYPISENCIQTISKIILFQSILSSEEPIYKSLYQVKFKN